MDIALAIFRLVPAGGIERHAIRIAEALLTRGHRVTLYTTAGEESAPPGSNVVRFSATAWANHALMSEFSARLAAEAGGRHDLLVGFQKLAGLDVLFCADWCYVAGQHPWYERVLPRYRTLAALERACFSAEARTRILLLAEPQRAAYAAAYGTPAARMMVLPPSVDRSRRAPARPTAAERVAMRLRRNLPAGATIWLWIGLQPHVKGLDRVIAALARDPGAMLLICGPQPHDLTGLFARARRDGIAERIQALGEVSGEDLNALFAASDLLVHPARLDVTGMVILEAMAAGLPVITTANCGFSTHVAAAEAGLVLAVPFEQAALDRALASADPDRRAHWGRNAFDYCADPALYSGIERACALIEAAAPEERAAARPAVAHIG